MYMYVRTYGCVYVYAFVNTRCFSLCTCFEAVFW
jgi:hypothetical protein